jgi:Family of unknown function (DUF6074)
MTIAAPLHNEVALFAERLQRESCDDPLPPDEKTAEVIPFPMVKRVSFLDRAAISIASCRKPDVAARIRERAAQQQRDAMQRRGLSEKQIEEQMAVFNSEIDWRLRALSHG